ncbi:MAG: hypothetical protein HY011_11895 [Acidobacteria bacterium]|nr:hypothetical protein [Acidobacteriota bacterium]
MKTLFYTACLLMVLSGYSQWQAFALQVVELARQQLPQPIAELWPVQTAAYQRVTVAGKEEAIAARLKETLRELSESESLSGARVSLKQVRFIPTKAATPAKAAAFLNVPDKARREEDAPESVSSTGYYVATINYDLISPLTVESGATVLTAACSCGVAQVRLSDGFGVMKTFRCPKVRN